MTAPATYTAEQLEAAIRGMPLSLVPNRNRSKFHPEKLFRVRKPARALARMADPTQGDGHTTVSVFPLEYGRLLLTANNSAPLVCNAMAYAAQLLHLYAGKNFSGAVRTRALHLLNIGWQPGITEDDAEAALAAAENNAHWS